MRGIPKGLGWKGYGKAAAFTWQFCREYGVLYTCRKIWNKIAPSLNREYNRWYRENEPTEEELHEQRKTWRYMAYQPLVSVIMPVYNPWPGVLQAAISSVLSQTYGRWELCIVDASEGRRREEVRNVLKKFEAQDQRIRVKLLDQNLGIAGNSNEALRMARGEFLALLDHDDTLAPFAFYRMIEQMNQDPTLDFLYSDRDLISWDGKKRFGPFFKPNWSPDLLLSVNYLIHLAFFRKSLLEQTGLFNEKLEGAQDWDLFFRITEITDKVAHLPGVLYHWRVGAGSAAWSRAAKPYVVESQIKAVSDHCRRLGWTVEIIKGKHDDIRLRWKLGKWEKVSIILIERAKNNRISRLLREILSKTNYSEYEIIFIKQANSTDGAGEGTIAPIRILKPEGDESVNECIKKAIHSASGEVLIFLDASVEITNPWWLEELSGWACQEGVAAVGCFFPEVEPWGPYPSLPKNQIRMVGSSHWYLNPFSLSWSCLSIRKDLLKQLYAREGELMPFSDPSDLWMKIKQAGYRNVFTPYAGVRKRSQGK